MKWRERLRLCGSEAWRNRGVWLSHDSDSFFLFRYGRQVWAEKWTKKGRPKNSDRWFTTNIIAQEQPKLRIYKKGVGIKSSSRKFETYKLNNCFPTVAAFQYNCTSLSHIMPSTADFRAALENFAEHDADPRQYRGVMLSGFINKNFTYIQILKHGSGNICAPSMGRWIRENQYWWTALSLPTWSLSSLFLSTYGMALCAWVMIISSGSVFSETCCRSRVYTPSQETS